MAPTAFEPVADRVVERRRAVALARHYREAEGLSIGQIAARLGRSPPTIKAYLYDPTGEKARAVKARYQGVCRGCGAYTQPRNGKGDAYAYCKACHPGAIERRWTRDRVLDAMRVWQARYGQLPSSYDWSRTHARRRGGRMLERLSEGDWPSASVVTVACGGWRRARADAAEPHPRTTAVDGDAPVLLSGVAIDTTEADHASVVMAVRI
jgi:AraC-like DNA-binding protein